MGEDTPVEILIDATAIPAELGGVGRYLQGLLAELPASGFRLTVVVRRGARALVAGLPPEAVVELGGWSGAVALRLLWEQVGLPALIRRRHVDVVFSPHYTMPLVTSAKRVVTLHDATFFTDRQVHQHLKPAFFRFWTRRALKRAAVVITPSQSSLDEIEAATGLTARAAVVAHHGVDTGMFHPPSAAEIDEFSHSFDLGDRGWIAFLGTLEPRKNLPHLVQGFVTAFQSQPETAPALVLAGGAGWDDALPAALRVVPTSLRVITPGYLPIEQLPALLGGAEIVAYPSLREGFGLPLLEAMSCSACVLTTRRPALPEVGGDAVEYTGVDAAAIADALLALRADPGRRETLRSSAGRRAAEFTWSASAAAHRRAFLLAVGR